MATLSKVVNIIWNEHGPIAIDIKLMTEAETDKCVDCSAHTQTITDYFWITDSDGNRRPEIERRCGLAYANDVHRRSIYPKPPPMSDDEFASFESQVFNKNADYHNPHFIDRTLRWLRSINSEARSKTITKLLLNNEVFAHTLLSKNIIRDPDQLASLMRDSLIKHNGAFFRFWLKTVLPIIGKKRFIQVTQEVAEASDELKKKCAFWQNYDIDRWS